MTNEEMTALNKKLYNFVGFTYKKHPNGNWLMYYAPNGEYIGDFSPDLVNSVDAQIKWIYPKLKESELRIEIDMDYGLWQGKRRYEMFHVAIKEGSHILKAFGEHKESLALAFAIAVEKYIDSLGEKIK